MKGMDVVVDKARRQCIVKVGNLDHSSPILDAHHQDDNIFKNLMTLKVKYDDELDKVDLETMKRAQDVKETISNNDEDCNFNG